MEDVAGLFADRRVVNSPTVARFVGLPEYIHEWGRALFVAKIGSAYIWCREDVEVLVGYLLREREQAPVSAI